MTHNSQARAESRVVKEPADNFFWALVDLPDQAADSRRLAQVSLRAMHEQLLEGVMLPSLGSLVWSVCDAKPRSHPESQRTQLLFCIQERSYAEKVWNTGAIHYGPSDVPDSLGVTNDPSSINLLRAELTPKPIQRLQRLRWLIIGGLGALITSSTLWGLERRIHVDSVTVLKRQAHLSALLQNAKAASVTELRARRDSLRATHELLDRASGLEHDAAAALSALLTAWPQSETAPVVQTELLDVQDDAIVIQAAFFDRPSATSLAQALSRFAGGPQSAANTVEWTLGQPQITSLNARPGQPSFNATFRLSRQSSNSTPRPNEVMP